MKSYWVTHTLAQKITEITNSLKICYLFNTNCIYFNTVHRRIEMTHQQQRCANSGRVSPRIQIRRIFLRTRTDADPIFISWCGCRLTTDPLSKSADWRELKNFRMLTSLINSEWAALGHAVIEPAVGEWPVTFQETIIANRLCRYSVNYYFWADACAAAVWIHCFEWPNYDFCISRGSVTTVFKVMWPKL